MATSSRTALRLARSVRDSRAGAPVLAEARAARWAGRSALNDERMLSEMLLRARGRRGRGQRARGARGGSRDVQEELEEPGEHGAWAPSGVDEEEREGSVTVQRVSALEGRQLSLADLARRLVLQLNRSLSSCSRWSQKYSSSR